MSRGWIVVLLWLAFTTAGVSRDLDDFYRSGMSFDAFMSDLKAEQEAWESNAERAVISKEVRASLDSLSRPWRLLAITEDQCSDSAHTLPFIAALVESTALLDMRLVRRSEALELLRERPNYRGEPAVPTIIILNEEGGESGCWIEHPAAQRAFHKRFLDPPQSARKRSKRAKEYLRWYQTDAGAMTVTEIMQLLEAAEQGARGCQASRTE
jgi:hypothetical protein